MITSFDVKITWRKLLELTSCLELVDPKGQVYPMVQLTSVKFLTLRYFVWVDYLINKWIHVITCDYFLLWLPGKRKHVTCFIFVNNVHKNKQHLANQQHWKEHKQRNINFVKSQECGASGSKRLIIYLLTKNTLY